VENRDYTHARARRPPIRGVDGSRNAGNGSDSPPRDPCSRGRGPWRAVGWRTRSAHTHARARGFLLCGARAVAHGRKIKLRGP